MSGKVDASTTSTPTPTPTPTPIQVNPVNNLTSYYSETGHLYLLGTVTLAPPQAISFSVSLPPGFPTMTNPIYSSSFIITSYVASLDIDPTNGPYYSMQGGLPNNAYNTALTYPVGLTVQTVGASVDDNGNLTVTVLLCGNSGSNTSAAARTAGEAPTAHHYDTFPPTIGVVVVVTPTGD